MTQFYDLRFRKMRRRKRRSIFAETSICARFSSFAHDADLFGQKQEAPKSASKKRAEGQEGGARKGKSRSGKALQEHRREAARSQNAPKNVIEGRKAGWVEAHRTTRPRYSQTRTSGSRRTPSFSYTRACTSAISCSTSAAVAPPAFTTKPVCLVDTCAPPTW